MGQSTFLQRLQAGETLIADGATGTNLLARGLPRGVPAEAWVLDQPDQITRLQKDFLDAGADILLTCTFGASSIRLDGSELDGRAIEINRRAVQLSRKVAQGNDVFIGGSMGPLGKLLKPYGSLSEDEAIASYQEQAGALTEAGADLLVIETQFDLAEATIAIKGARLVSALPIVCSFSFDRGTRTMMGVTPSQLGKEMTSMGVDVVGINCGRSLEDNLAALKELRQSTALPIWFKPNAGLPEIDEKGISYYKITPEVMGALTPQWLSAGAQVIGGCCGTSPDHLRQIARVIHPI